MLDSNLIWLLFFKHVTYVRLFKNNESAFVNELTSAKFRDEISFLLKFMRYQLEISKTI